MLELAAEVREKTLRIELAAATIFDHRRFFLQRGRSCATAFAISTTMIFGDISTRSPLMQPAKRMPHREPQRKRRRRRHPAMFSPRSIQSDKLSTMDYISWACYSNMPLGETSFEEPTDRHATISSPSYADPAIPRKSSGRASKSRPVSRR